MIAPEYILTKAVLNWAHARSQLRLLHKSVPETRGPIVSTHMLFADMGGFVVEYCEGCTRSESSNGTSDFDTFITHQNCNQKRLASSTHPSEASKKSLAEVRDEHSDVERKYRHPPKDKKSTEQAADHSWQTRYWHMSSIALRKALEDGTLSPTLPSTEEIFDKSKGDIFTKGVAVLQIAYYLLTLLVRVGLHLAISQLELGTTGFTIFAILMYSFALSKPKSVYTSIVLRKCDGELSNSSKRRADPEDANFSWWSVADPSEPPHNDELPLQDSYSNTLFLDVGAAACTLIAATILSGWHLSFPTMIDVWLWRIAGLLHVAVPAVFVIRHTTGILLDYTSPDKSLTHRSLVAVVSGGSLVVYVLARLIVIVEMFRTLFYLPPSAFVTTWTAELPHFG